MLLVFWLTFNVIGSTLSDWLSLGIDQITGAVDAGLTAYGINPVVHSLIIDGVFAGVGSVLSFLPIIVTLFFFLSILEDTGYMARVAFVMPFRTISPWTVTVQIPGVAFKIRTVVSWPPLPSIGK